MGRQTDCHLRIPANDVSRNHCEIMLSGDQAEIADMGSRNGTYVNRERVKRRALVSGDLIAVGPTVFLVQIDGEPAEDEVDAREAYHRGRVDTTGAGAGVSPGMARGDEVRTSGGVLGGVKGQPIDASDSSAFEFEFDLDEDDEDDQPPL